MFEGLASISKTMEGEKYVLASWLWPALRRVEGLFAGRPADSPGLAALRLAMFNDHKDNRITLAKSVAIPLHVFMHLCDPRYLQCPSIFN